MRARSLFISGLLSLLLVLLPVMSSSAAPTWSGARIAIVYPHDAEGHAVPVERAPLVNVSVWPGPDGQVSCTDPPNPMPLFMAKNNDVARPVRMNGQMILRTINGVTFPSIEYNNIPVDLPTDPSAKYSFYAGYVGASNVWVHAADPRSYAPQQVVPTSVDTGYPPLREPADARIQVVWPHDEQGNAAPVDRATRVNVAVDFFVHGTRVVLGPRMMPDVNTGPYLAIAEDNGQLQEFKEFRGILLHDPIVQPGGTTYSINGLTYFRYIYNNVPVRPGHQYHFAVSTFVNAGGLYTTVWTHATDARTNLPQPVVPPACGP